MSEHSFSQAQTERNIRHLRQATVVAYLVAFSLLVLTAGYGLGQLRGAHAHLEEVMALQNLKLRLIAETQVASYRRADSVQRLILETDPFRQDEVFMAFLANGFKVGDGRNRIRALLSSEAEKAVLAEQDAIVAEAVVLHDQIADLARSGRHEAARIIYSTQVAALHERGNTTFQALRDLQTQAADQAIGAANQAYRTTLRDTVLAMLASLVVSAAIGLLLYRVSNRVTDNLRRNVGDLRHMATHDSLTGLPNRNALTQLIEQQFGASERFALLYMDLDGFKQVNDAHGHELGDRLLKMAASRIRGRLRGVDTVARIGGDEFVALLHGVSEPDECEHAARHIIEAFSEPFVHRDVQADIGVSIGVALAPVDGREAGQILGAADRAMYRAKSRGSNRYELQPAPPGLALAERAAV